MQKISFLVFNDPMGHNVHFTIPWGGEVQPRGSWDSNANFNFVIKKGIKVVDKLTFDVKKLKMSEF